MLPAEDKLALRRRLMAEFTRVGVTPTAEALTVLVESISRSVAELVGDTDTLLLGLAYAGSHAIDVLETAGADLASLRRLAALSAGGHVGLRDVDPVGALFTSDAVREFLVQQAGEAGVLETGFLLRAAVSPELGEGRFGFNKASYTAFPLEQCQGGPPPSQLHGRLQARVCELIAYLGSYFVVEMKGPQRFRSGEDDVPQFLRARHHPVTPAEDAFLDRELGHSHRDMELDEFEFAIRALNEWFVRRRILTDPAALCLRTVNRCESLLFGPQLLAAAGGDLKEVESQLQLADRVAPERDQTGLTLISRDGRVHIGQYTYRNTFLSDTRTEVGFPIRRVAVQAVRPVSLLPAGVLCQLEDLLSRPSPHKADIGRFLQEHPEFLQVLGYQAVVPHLCLRTEGSSDALPDFLLETPGRTGFDLLNLGLPTAPIITPMSPGRLSDELVRAVRELRRHEQFFDSAGNRKAFYRKYGFTAFKPELAVIIGRSGDFRTADERAAVEAELGKIRLVTYDDLLAYGQSRSIVRTLH